MARKKITPDSVVNPLEGSAFFKSEPAPSTDSKPADSAGERGRDNKANALIKRADIDETSSTERRGRPPKKRKTSRHSFEFYADQVELIYKLVALRQFKEGKNISLSDIVREALDEYIAKYREELKQFE